ncbi:RNA polymerase principal sigma factor HrdB [Pseudobythopirellula maris]|uniref:RNA polymerase principal sigma factor HrdB n=1 Tax=Pseudobythopirellula maris TaxID=2527991 RepID=A0A5C5ZMB9_9BACT|nr:sigma-70 family RNA polymerase sigma factor [Pseudobythopirellula maris]TWT87583.1 RNA polymerase principal sigma factor HrdB [Pseudobythopirellula maris]
MNVSTADKYDCLAAGYRDASPTPIPADDFAAKRLKARAEELAKTEWSLISHPNFKAVDNPDSEELGELAQRIERGESVLEPIRPAGLPSHLARMCATPLLSQEEEHELFRRMNLHKHFANRLRAKLNPKRPSKRTVARIESHAERADLIRNHLIQANTRLVVSITKKYANAANDFDELLSQGITSLLRAIEKFDLERGYRFSTYATCAVRRDLYRMVTDHTRLAKRHGVAASDVLDNCAEEPQPEPLVSETHWKRVSRTLAEMMSALDERERSILVARFGLDREPSDNPRGGSKVSYSTLGKRLGISKERVRQLANRALEKLRDSAQDRRLEALLA